MNVVQVKQVSKVFQGDSATPIKAVSEVSFVMEEGAFIALAGPSGSGKTTILNLIGCLDCPTSGEIYLDGEKTNQLNQIELARLRLRKIGFIFQDFNLIPTLTAVENVEFVLWLQGIDTAQRRKMATEICERFGIGELIHRRPAQMSRGQQQRVAIARAIVHRPRIVLGDEFTANLDHKTGADLVDFLKELNRKDRITFLYATHDPVMMKRADKIIKMQDGCLLETINAAGV